MNIKPILIVAGEPYSVFSEILSKSIKKYGPKRPLVIIGSSKLLEKQIKFLKYKISFNIINKNFEIKNLKKKKLNLINVDFKFKKNFDIISNISFSYNYECFKIACNLMKTKKFIGLINGPISKKHFLKNKFLGITEFLAKKTKTNNFAMLIFNKKLAVSPLTTHLSLKDVSKNISKKKIINQVKLIKEFYKKNLKKDPKIAITGVNPHCESNSAFNEENQIINPALKYLKKRYKKINGPYPTDSLFMSENIKKFDVVIGMYHDQVLTPMKSIFNFDAINITLGLPFIRISPDHGPNNQMIGKNKSNPQSLISAIKFLDLK